MKAANEKVRPGLIALAAFGLMLWLAAGVVVSAECGADGLTIGHYDGAPFSNLRAILEGMKLADVEIVKRK